MVPLSLRGCLDDKFPTDYRPIARSCFDSITAMLKTKTLPPSCDGVPKLGLLFSCVAERWGAAAAGMFLLMARIAYANSLSSATAIYGYSEDSSFAMLIDLRFATEYYFISRSVFASSMSRSWWAIIDLLLEWTKIRLIYMCIRAQPFFRCQIDSSDDSSNGPSDIRWVKGNFARMHM